jgi:hypothetical protein
MDVAGAWPARLRGLGIAGCLVIAAIALDGPRTQLAVDTIYPWWTWVLVAAGIACGLLLAVAPVGARGACWSAVAAGVALVVSAQLAGTGIVAAKHWHPAFGMGGGYGDLAELERLARVIAVAGLVAVVLAAWELLAAGAVVRRLQPRSPASLAVGLVVVAVFPLVVIANARESTDLTSWGALGLIYAGPWGMGLVVSAWCDRTARLALQGAVIGGAVLAAVGPQMIDLLIGVDDLRFGIVALLVAPLLVGSLVVGRSHAAVGGAR